MFGELLSRVGYGGERVAVKQREEAVAAPIGAEDLRRLKM